jgi:hypothetical protein
MMMMMMMMMTMNALNYYTKSPLIKKLASTLHPLKMRLTSYSGAQIYSYRKVYENIDILWFIQHSLNQGKAALMEKNQYGRLHC